MSFNRRHSCKSKQKFPEHQEAETGAKVYTALNYKAVIIAVLQLFSYLLSLKPRIAQLERDLERLACPNPLGKEAWMRLLSILSNCTLKISSNGDTTTSLGKLFQWTIVLTAEMCLFYFEMTPLPVTNIQLYSAAYTPGPKASRVVESEKNHENNLSSNQWYKLGKCLKMLLQSHWFSLTEYTAVGEKSIFWDRGLKSLFSSSNISY